MTLTVEFCGQTFAVDPNRAFSIGREADLSVDQDNRFLHRRLLVISRHGDLWMIANVGSQLTSTVSEAGGQMEAFLGPGGALPLVFRTTTVRFSAGATTYELTVTNPSPLFRPPIAESVGAGETTVSVGRLTSDQRLLIVALAEHHLRGDGKAAVTLPTSAQAAQRLEWTMTKFNRKLDNVCQKLERHGVQGLHGGLANLASNRRARLVEYAIATRLVTRDHLSILDDPALRAASEELQET